MSDWLVHTNRRADGAWEQRYQHGRPTGPLRAVQSAGGQGTTVHYLPTQEVFTDGALTPDRIDEAARFSWLRVTVQV